MSNQGALNGILLLQDTYDFDVQSAVAKGTIEYMDHENQIKILKSGEKLVKSDLIDLSKVAKEKNLYDKAIMFMQEANKWVLLNTISYYKVHLYKDQVLGLQEFKGHQYQILTN